jgi:hypothetical protein
MAVISSVQPFVFENAQIEDNAAFMCHTPIDLSKQVSVDAGLIAGHTDFEEGADLVPVIQAFLHFYHWITEGTASLQFHGELASSI